MIAVPHSLSSYFSRHDEKISWRELVVLSVVISLLLFAFQGIKGNSVDPQADEKRYIFYSTALYEHGVFGLYYEQQDVPGFFEKHPDKPFAPTNANVPIYPMFVTGLMFLDRDFAETLVCFAHNVDGKGDIEACPSHYETVVIAQTLVSLVALLLVYMIALRLSRNRAMAWVSVFGAVISGIFTEFSTQFMTEIVILPVFFALMHLTLVFYDDRRLRWVFALGAVLGLLTLIRPSHLYLFYGFVLFFVGMIAVVRTKATFVRTLVLILGFVLCVSPWAMRNYNHFGSPKLTAGTYAGLVLSERIAYNRMSYAEWGASFLYWFPDVGDSLSEKFLPPSLYNKLGWEDGTYYRTYSKQIYFQNLEEAGGNDALLVYLLKEEILPDIVKHVMVSIPLALRASFVAKYWGVVGFIAFLVLLYTTMRRKDYRLLVMSLPVLYMVAFNAGVSVSIPRYNFPLIALYAFAMAWAVCSVSFRIYKPKDS